uniref:Uncharacterized protein n=1 Tax=Arundo donax TaxID=35708 RepID=A0A0A8ZMT8_ARUDO
MLELRTWSIGLQILCSSLIIEGMKDRYIGERDIEKTLMHLAN